MLNKKWFIVAGKRESPVFDMPFEMPMISPDGNKMAYIEQHFDTKKSNLVVCTLEMKKRANGKDYDAITRIKASKTNSRFAYIVVRNGKQAVVSAGFPDTEVLNENEGPAFDQILTLDVSDDGSHLAYLARRDKTVLLVKDGVEIPFPEHEMRSQTLIGKDGRTFNAGVTHGRFFTVMDGKKYGDSYDGIKDPVFSADGSMFAFVARNGDKNYVVINGSSGAQYDMVVSPQFSPDGSRLIYRARQDGKRFVVIADAKGITVEQQPDYDMVWQPVITPDGKSIAYSVKTGRELWWKVEPLK
jgi:Tol biopolymer transport system component